MTNGNGPLGWLAKRTFVHTLVRVAIHWDQAKAQANQRAHGISFAEAATVLADEFALTREDPDATDEQRFVMLGMSATGTLLVVVYEKNRR